MLILPYGDENPIRRFAVINWALIIANVVVFLYEVQLAQAGQLQAALMHWALIPADVTRHLGVEQVLDMVRSMFLHGGWLHLLGNMLFLGIFGDDVESALGSFRYLVFYFLAGIAACLAQVALTPYSTSPFVGASGAIAGVLGAYLVLFPNAKVRILFWLLIIVRTFRIPAFVVLGVWFILQLIPVYYTSLGVAAPDNVGYGAHVGGFIAGIVLLLFFPPQHTGIRRAQGTV